MLIFGKKVKKLFIKTVILGIDAHHTFVGGGIGACVWIFRWHRESTFRIDVANADTSKTRTTYHHSDVFYSYFLPLLSTKNDHVSQSLAIGVPLSNVTCLMYGHASGLLCGFLDCENCMTAALHILFVIAK